MDNPYGQAINRYQDAKMRAAIKADPAGQLAKMMGILDVRREATQAGDDAVDAMCGVMLYRYLDRMQQRDVLQRIQDLVDHGYRALGGRLRGLVATNIAFPNMNTWAMSVNDLRKMAKSSEKVKSLLDTIGLHVSLNTPSVLNLATASYLVMTRGAKTTAYNMAGADVVEEMAGRRLSSGAAKRAGVIYLFVLAIGTVLYEFADVDDKRAGKEGTMRGAIKSW